MNIKKEGSHRRRPQLLRHLHLCRMADEYYQHTRFHWNFKSNERQISIELVCREPQRAGFASVAGCGLECTPRRGGSGKSGVEPPHSTGVRSHGMQFASRRGGSGKSGVEPPHSTGERSHGMQCTPRRGGTGKSGVKPPHSTGERSHTGAGTAGCLTIRTMSHTNG